jgi:hypothetical protein
MLCHLRPRDVHLVSVRMLGSDHDSESGCGRPSFQPEMCRDCVTNLNLATMLTVITVTMLTVIAAPFNSQRAHNNHYS